MSRGPLTSRLSGGDSCVTRAHLLLEESAPSGGGEEGMLFDLVDAFAAETDGWVFEQQLVR